MHDFRTYEAAADSILLERLGSVVTDVANLHEELAMIEADNIREKARVLQTCGETSSNGRRDRVNMGVVEGPATATTLAGELAALIEEKWYIVRILDSRR